jgi:P27 family predicted phage terminase small subunit
MPVTVVAAPAALPPPPDTLGASGRAHWCRVWNQGRAWLCELDYGAAQRYCETFDLRDSMIAAVRAEGLTTAGSTGQPTAHPLIARIEAFNAELRLLEGQLGLTPSARATIGLGEVRAVSKLDEMLARRAKPS